MLRSLMIILVVGALVASAHPASMFPSRRRISLKQDTVATVDCSDREAVKNVLKTHANFRCVYPNWNRPSGFTAPTESKLFPDGLESASLVRSSERRCEPGFLFSPDVNLCLAAHKPLHPIALQSDNLVAENPIMEIMSFANGPNSAADCPRGTLFNSELRICSEYSKSSNSRPLSTLNLVREDVAPAALEIRSFAGEAQSAADCKPGEVFAMDVNLCVDMSPRPPRSPGLQSASLVRSRVKPTNPPLVFRKDCRDDQIYLSEVGICTKRPNGKRRRKPASDSLVRATPAPVAPRVVVQEKTTCAPGETYNPSINGCLPLSSSQIHPTPPSSESLVKEPVHLEIESAHSTITADDCRRLGKIFVGELGVCM